MAEESQPECILRRRKYSGPNLPLNLDVGGYQVTEGGPCQGTPSPSVVKFDPEIKDLASSSALINFRKKQQSFEINELEECEVEEIIVDSDEEDGPDEKVDRAPTPIPIADFGANVIYAEGSHTIDFIKVQTLQNDCLTDVSDAESDDGEI